jgi:hypothetical protein
MYFIDYKNLIILILSIFLLTTLIKSCNDQEENKKLKLDLENISKIKDSLGNIITVKDAQIVESKEAIKELRDAFFKTSESYNKQIKEVKALITTRTLVHIDTVEVPIVDTGKMKKWADSITLKCKDVIKYYEDSTVKIGARAKDSTKHYNIEMTVNKTSIGINQLSFIDSQYVALTTMKGGLFKKNTQGKRKFFLPSRTRVEIKHTNPYFQNTGADAFILDKKTKRNYRNGLLHGAIGGAALTILLLLSL